MEDRSNLQLSEFLQASFQPLKAIVDHSPDITDWAAWCADIWRESEKQWIIRDGQDHFYREAVVLPALVKEISETDTDFHTLVDLGSGDGHVTNLLIEASIIEGRPLTSVFLIDRSRLLLSAALSLAFLNNAYTINADLAGPGWSNAVSASRSPRLFLSVFVLQEIPVLSGLLGRIAETMSSRDTCLVLFVAPNYSYGLSQRNAIQIIQRGDSSTDWEWAGKYPISIDSTTIFVPHFQRSMEAYQEVIARSGLRCSEPRFLSVPDTVAAREIFARTIYGESIIGERSSVLLRLEKK